MRRAFSVSKQGRTKGKRDFELTVFTGFGKNIPRSGEQERSNRTPSTLRWISLQAEKIKTAVNQIVTTEKAVSDLPISLRLKFTHWQTGLKIVKWNGLLYFVLLWNLEKKDKTGNPVRRFFARTGEKQGGSKIFYVHFYVYRKKIIF